MIPIRSCKFIFSFAKVTEEVPVGPRRVHAADTSTMIHVQPLKRSEMQVCPFYVSLIYISHDFFAPAFICPGSWHRRSHARNLWFSFARVGLPRWFLWRFPMLSITEPLSQCSARCAFLIDSRRAVADIVSRLGRPRLTLWTILQVGRSRSGPGQCLHGITSRCRC